MSKSWWKVSPRGRHQISCVFVCLYAQWVCVPFLLTNPHSVDISLTAYNQTFQAPWVGTVELDEAGKWFDDFMLLVSGRCDVF